MNVKLELKPQFLTKWVSFYGNYEVGCMGSCVGQSQCYQHDYNGILHNNVV